jgi:hypothetical protein
MLAVRRSEQVSCLQRPHAVHGAHHLCHARHVRHVCADGVHGVLSVLDVDMLLDMEVPLFSDLGCPV